jgi:hypothetical protein
MLRQKRCQPQTPLNQNKSNTLPTADYPIPESYNRSGRDKVEDLKSLILNNLR